MIKHLPNALTCANLLCGCFGILNLFAGGTGTFFGIVESPVMSTAYFVWAACVFDFLDGFAARALNVSSPVGKELDSLADVVSFGVLPAFFMYQLIGMQAGAGAERYLNLVALAIAVFSALRLAIFNVDKSQSDSFRGLPTPANALFITSLTHFNMFISPALFSPWTLAAISIVFSLLLVSRMPLFALKFKTLRWDSNKLRFTFLALAVLLLMVWGSGSLPLIILMYILLSLVNNSILKPSAD